MAYLRLFLLLVLCLAAWLGYYGALSPVTIRQQSFGPVFFVYEKHAGPYRNIKPVMDRVYAALKDREGVATTRGIGVYYDNPNKVEAAKLRSLGGCLLDEADEALIASLKSKGYRVGLLPARPSAVTSFPFHGALSIYLGMWRVYPKIAAYWAENKLPECPLVEIYDTPGKRTFYVIPFNIEQARFDEMLK